jgi:hypothetical protein
MESKWIFFLAGLLDCCASALVESGGGDRCVDLRSQLQRKWGKVTVYSREYPCMHPVHLKACFGGRGG